MTPSRTRWFFPLLLLPALALRLWSLTGTGLWYDEAYCWWVATAVPLSQTLALSTRELIPPFYYLFLRLWIPLAGDSEFALRLPSVLMGVLAVAVAARLAYRLTRQRIAAFAALFLFTFSSPLLWAAREVRMYGPLLTWTLISGMALVEALESRHAHHQRRWAWLWAGASLISLYHLVLTGFWLLGQGLFALYTLVRRGRSAFAQGWRAFFLPGLAVVLLYLPWVLPALWNLGHNASYWAGYLPIDYFAQITARGMVVVEHFPTESAAGVSAGVLLLATLALLLTRYRPWAALYPLGYVPPLAAMAYLFRTLPKWGVHHAALFAPAPSLALALAWGAVGVPSLRRRRGLLLTLLIPGTLLTLAPQGIADRNLLTPSEFSNADWRGAAQYVLENRRPNEPVVIETGSVFQAWQYYDRSGTLLPLPPDDLLNVENVLYYPETAAQLNTGLQNAAGVWWVGWIDSVTDPTALGPTLIETLGSETPVPTFHGLKLRHFILERRAGFPTTPAPAARPNQILLPDLTLWGYDYPQELHPADHPLEITAWWTTDNPAAHIGRYYMALLSLEDAAGTRWAQIDTPIATGDFRPEHWQPGRPVLGRYPLALPSDIPPGRYTPTLKLYSPGYGEGVLSLAPLTITRPTVPLAVPPEALPARIAGPAAPIDLQGVQIESATTGPCGEFSGRLFWEARQPTLAPYRVTLSLGSHSVELPLLPDSPPEPWQAGDRFVTRFRFAVPCRAPNLRALLSIRLSQRDGQPMATAWDGPELEIAGRNYAPPTAIQPLQIDFGPQVAALVGYRFDPPAPRPNEPVTITLIWRAGQTGDIPYSVFVHVVPAENPTAQPLAQSDAWPVSGARPTYSWLPDEIIEDPHPLPALPPGAYRLRLGLYTAEQGRLPVAAAEGVTADNAFELPLELK